MDVYVLDTSFDAVEIIDEYESFIWTERYSEYGDFTLVTQPTIKMRLLLKTGTFLSIVESKRVMIIEDVLVESVDGKNILTVTGRSLESILEYRAVRPGQYEWYVRSTIGDIVRDMVWRICVVANALSPNDVIPNLMSINESTSTKIVDTTIAFKPVYTAIKELCDSDELGFKITLRDESPRLVFSVYSGEAKPNIVFSSELDTLIDQSFLLSQKTYYNIAYVYGKNGVQIVAAPGVDVTVQGFDRRVLVVDANDIDPANMTATEYTNMIKQRGLEALAKNQYTKTFDGTLPEDSPFRYETHYSQGDVVVIADGVNTRSVRITEYIWACDENGESAYPTFT